MEHVVFFPAPEGAQGFRRACSLEEAVHLVEHLRNVEGLDQVEVHAMTPVALSFRAYYRVEVPAAATADSLPAGSPQSADVEAGTEPVESSPSLHMVEDQAVPAVDSGPEPAQDHRVGPSQAPTLALVQSSDEPAEPVASIADGDSAPEPVQQAPAQDQPAQHEPVPHAEPSPFASLHAQLAEAVAAGGDHDLFEDELSGTHPEAHLGLREQPLPAIDDDVPTQPTPVHDSGAQQGLAGAGADPEQAVEPAAATEPVLVEPSAPRTGRRLAPSSLGFFA